MVFSRSEVIADQLACLPEEYRIVGSGLGRLVGESLEPNKLSAKLPDPRGPSREVGISCIRRT